MSPRHFFVCTFFDFRASQKKIGGFPTATRLVSSTHVVWRIGLGRLDVVIATWTVCRRCKWTLWWTADWFGWGRFLFDVFGWIRRDSWIRLFRCLVNGRLLGGWWWRWFDHFMLLIVSILITSFVKQKIKNKRNQIPELDVTCTWSFGAFRPWPKLVYTIIYETLLFSPVISLSECLLLLHSLLKWC